VKAGGNVPIVYCIDSEALGSVFYSQVLKPILAVATEAAPIQVLALCPLGEFVKPSQRERWAHLVAHTRKNPNVTLHRIPSSVCGWHSAWLSRNLVWAWLRLHFALGMPIILHCRNSPITAVVLSLKKKWLQSRVLYDSRCIEAEELNHRYRVQRHISERIYRKRHSRMALEQKQALEGADFIVCVSRRMADTYQSNHRVPSERMEVLPCAVDVQAVEAYKSQREAVRKNLNLTDKFVLAYVGSAAAYQCIEQSLALYQRVREGLSDLHLLVLTTEKQKLDSILQASFAPSQYTVISTTPDAVFSYLVAADTGLLLRDDLPLNHVASPVKYGEYLASGVPVIITPHVGDFSQLTQSTRCGLVLDNPTDPGHLPEVLRFLERVRDHRESWAKHCTDVARLHLDLGKNTSAIRKVYQAIANATPRALHNADSLPQC
jgi:glycosyltransferase involved in cell wall biosynthesis